MIQPIAPRVPAALARSTRQIWIYHGGRSVQVRIGAVRRLALIAAAAAATTAAAPPPVLAPYVVGGRFDTGDFGWMRGAFAGASPAQRDDWRAIGEWRRRCDRDDDDALRAALARRGIVPVGSRLSMGNGPCGAIGYAMPRGDQGDDWAIFQAAVARARSVTQAIVWSAALAQARADSGARGDAASLVARPMTDQVLRGALSWGKGDIRGAPPLDPAARGIAEGMLWSAIAERDHANTAWLKTMVARRGWPTVAMVGARASEDAWLLVQHADDDPVFQLDMLRLMKPLAARGEVSRRNYAMLYDRVMLKLTGKQRYGAMATCIGGRWAPMPLEDATTVDRWRRSAGMSTLAENLARITASSGPCPPDVIPPSPTKR